MKYLNQKAKNKHQPNTYISNHNRNLNFTVKAHSVLHLDHDLQRLAKN